MGIKSLKDRHMIESNRLLEKRYLNEQITPAKYGDITNVDPSTASSATTQLLSGATQGGKIDIFSDNALQQSKGQYPLGKISKAKDKDKEYFVVDLGSMKVTTDCNRIKNRDNSFDERGGKVYSTELAKKVGEMCPTKFPV
jgi:hypothetical protein